MGGSQQQPFLYAQEKFDDARFPQTTFDPKAVTRASWEVKPPRPKQNGPFISFNRHPDAHEAPTPRRRYKVVSPRTKSWIKALRVVQLCLRLLELVGALGILALFILLSKVDESTAWILRITAGVVSIHCVYAIYHLARPAGGRTPASSASYMLFAGISDLCVMALYAYGVLCVVNNNPRDNWSTLLPNGRLLEYFVPAAYYTFISGAGLHFVSLLLSAWLGYQFRQITLMPPDMNPLESHLTSSRNKYKESRHKRNKSSVATTSTTGTGSTASVNRLSTPLESHRRSGVPYEDVASRPPSIPFSHTRTGSQASSTLRDSRSDLPSRAYQITPGNSPRNSMAFGQTPSSRPQSSRPTSNRASYYDQQQHQQQLPSQTSRGLYAEVPLDEPTTTSTATRDSNGTTESQQSGPARTAKFTEAWYTSDSLVNRTQERNRAINHLVSGAIAHGGGRRPYHAVIDHRRRLGEDDGVSDESGDEDLDSDGNSGLYDDATRTHSRSRPRSALAIPRGVSPLAPSLDETTVVDENDLSTAPPVPPQHNHHQLHSQAPPSQSQPTSSSSYDPRPPHPLRSNPTTLATPSPPSHRPQTPYRRPGTALSEVSNNSRSVSGSQDIADLKLSSSSTTFNNDNSTPNTDTPPPTKRGILGRDLSKRSTWYGGGLSGSNSPRNRNSSIQPEAGVFYSKPYGELKPGTPPVMLNGNNGNGSGTGSPASGGGGRRQLSSGNDYYDLGTVNGKFGRRNVSGKMAEEGRAGGEGGRFARSRYSVLNN